MLELNHYVLCILPLIKLVTIVFLQMIFPWIFDEMQALKPLKEAAHLLAEKKDWPPLYDVATLKNNKV